MSGELKRLYRGKKRRGEHKRRVSQGTREGGGEELFEEREEDLGGVGRGWIIR